MGSSTECSSSEEEGRSKSKGSRKRKAKKDRKSTSSKKKREKSPRENLLEPVDQDDVNRLLLSLLQLSSQMEAELMSVFKQLDSWGIVYLHDLADARLRKKLRHLFRALLLGEVEGERGKGWRKVPSCKMSLSKFVKRCCKELRSQQDLSSAQLQAQPSASAANEKDRHGEVTVEAFDIDEADRRAEAAVQAWREENAGNQVLSPGSSEHMEPPVQQAEPARGAPVREQWMLEAPAYLRCLAAKEGPDARRRQILQQKKKDDEEAVRVKVVMEEWNKARKVKSLREMREEGEYAEGQEAYKRWKRSMDIARSVWGKRAAEQAAEQDFQDDAKKGQPWQRFDRDRVLQAPRRVSQADYQKLIEQAKLGARFRSSWEPSAS